MTKTHTPKLMAASLWTGFLFTHPALAAKVTPKQVITTYSDIAHQTYTDSLATAKDLEKAVNVLVKSPSKKSLTAARSAWIKSRVPYQQTEVFRFGNPIVDDWEGKVNAWPLDEGLIDYVDTGRYGDSDENPYHTANIIANPAIKMGSKTFTSPQITEDTLSALHELESLETNVATGYHAIEFLLWGQDLNGHGPGAGNRPHTDFDVKNCSGGNCDRRNQYLKAATSLLIKDLQYMVGQWAPGGSARTNLTKGDEKLAIKAIITGMGSLSYGELAGERIKLGLMLHDPEEEHDCFSDNTHNSHYYNGLGIKNVYLGEYKGVSKTIKGAGLSSLTAQKSPKLDKEMRHALATTQSKMQKMVDTAEGGKAYDEMLKAGDKEGATILTDVVNALTSQTKSIEKLSEALQLNDVAFEGSDSLDNPSKVN